MSDHEIKTIDQLPQATNIDGSESMVLGNGATLEKATVSETLDAVLPKSPAIIDGLRRSVEAASGGKMTVHYTAKGQASYFFIQPAFLASDVDPNLPDELHPMFVAGGQERSESHIGAFQGVISNGELISIPGVDPTVSRNIDQYLSAARACGAGFGLMTNVDFAGIGAWCRANEFYPRGNTDYGRDRHKPFETGVRQDGMPVGENHGNDRILTGSGPAGWRHNNSMVGISDIVGNAYEWTPGARLVDGEVHIIKDNDMSLDDTDHGANSSAWRAIDYQTGELVSPGHANAVRFALSGAADGTLVINSGGNFRDIAGNAISAEAQAVLKLHGLFPLGSDIPDDRFYLDVEGERVPRRGGYWHPGARPGVFTADFNHTRTSTNTAGVARPRFTI